MRYTAIANTDIGNTKKVNQDSVLIKHAMANDTEVLMAVICDGMGGLANGELASATVVRTFSKWFDEELEYELERLDMRVIAEKWALLLKDLNVKISKYSERIKVKGMGTTFSGILFVGNEYIIVHVGDSRIYEIDNFIKQLTSDHTVVARKIKEGKLTLEQAKNDKERNKLTQCVGASPKVIPEILYGKTKIGGYLLCSDGFRHQITEQEIYETLSLNTLKNKAVMHEKVLGLIDLVKQRRERDNISAILIKTE